MLLCTSNLLNKRSLVTNKISLKYIHPFPINPNLFAVISINPCIKILEKMTHCGCKRFQ